MDIIRHIFEILRSVVIHPITRAIVIVIVIVSIAYGAWWYFMRYRPQTYLNAAYSSWALFERAVLDARAREYQYDPYGQLSADLKDVYEQGQGAKEKFSRLNPPTKRLREVQRKSLSVIDRYLAVQETIVNDIKKEADYYYGLLGELKSFFDNQNPSAARIRLNNPALARSNFYEETWREYQLLDSELDALLTKVQIASVPSRLKEFHVLLIQLLRDSQSIAESGVKVYRQFIDAVSDKKYSATSASLASLASRITSVEVAPGAASISAADATRFANSPSTAGRQFLENEIKRQADVQKVADYLPFFIDAQEFFQKYDGAFSPPVLGLVRGGEKLSDVTVQSEVYAVQWARYDVMIHELEDLLLLGLDSAPPSTVLAFHTEMIGAFQDYILKAKDALTKFRQFNETLSGDQFETLERNITRLQSIVASDLDFANVWNLQDIVRSQADIGPDFDVASRAWVDELVRYRVLESGGSELNSQIAQ